MIRGMLVRWQGLKITLKIPQMNEAAIAAKGVLSMA